MREYRSELEKEVIQGTIRNRNETIKILEQFQTEDIVLVLIENMKQYSQDEDCLTGQYMVLLDAVQAVLTKRKFIKKIETWTLEEFLNEIPYHSGIVEGKPLPKRDGE